MTSPRKGYIFYIESMNTRSFINEKLQAAHCDIIYEQRSPHDVQTLRSCMLDLNPGDTLILWRLDKSIPKYHNKVSWLADLLARNIRVISLADRLTLEYTPEHPSTRFFLFLKNRRLQSALQSRSRHHRLSREQTASIYHAINSNKCTVSRQARKYAISRTTLYAALQRYKESLHDEK